MTTLPTSDVAARLAADVLTPTLGPPERPPGAQPVPITESVCGECGTTVADTARQCPRCRQTTGPFRRLEAFTVLVEDHDRRRWLVMVAEQDGRWVPRWARPVTDDEARWLTRQPADPTHDGDGPAQAVERRLW